MRVDDITRAAEETSLLESWSAEDPRVLGLLYRRYAPAVLRFLINKVRDEHEAEDLLHDTFIALKRGAAPTREPSSFRPGTFILGVANHVFLNHLRARGRRSRRELDFGEVALSELEAGLSSLICAGQQADAVLTALREIPVAGQMLLELKIFEGLSDGEIGEVLTIDPGAVRGRIDRAKRRLKQRVDARLGLACGEDRLERWVGDALTELWRRHRAATEPGLVAG